MNEITVKNLFYRFEFNPELVPNRIAHWAAQWISVVEIRVYGGKDEGFVAIDVFGVPLGTNGQPDNQAKLKLVAADPDWTNAKLDELIKVHNLIEVQAALGQIPGFTGFSSFEGAGEERDKSDERPANP